MELEKFEEVYQVLEAQKEKDETAAELYADVKEFAYKYATMRYRFSEMSREEKPRMTATAPASTTGSWTASASISVIYRITG